METKNRFIRKITFYLLIFLCSYSFWLLFDIIERRYIAIISVIAFGMGFLASLGLYKRHLNPFLPIVPLLYLMAASDEINSALYLYSANSYKLWNLGNWFILAVVIYEIFLYIKNYKK